MIFLDKYRIIKKLEEMNHVFVDLVKNLSTVMVLYKFKQIAELKKSKLIHQQLLVIFFLI